MKNDNGHTIWFIDSDGLRKPLKPENPYKDMIRAIAWAAGFTYAETHPDAEQVMDHNITSNETREGFAAYKDWLSSW